MTQEATTEMGRYIWKILLMGGSKTMSWGIDPSTLKTIENGIKFHVQGFKHKGTVEISYDEGSDYFIVAFVKDEDATDRTIVEDVAFDELVDVIDRHVEYTGKDYKERVRQECKLAEN